MRMVEDVVQESLATLPDLQRRVLELRFGFLGGSPATIAKISEVTGIAEHKIPELMSEALDTLGQRLQAVEEMRAA